MGILMEALGRQVYNGRVYLLGETIDVSTELDASDMTALHLARRLPALLTPVAQSAVERSMECAVEEDKGGKPAAPVASGDVAPHMGKKNTRYKHREMRVQR